MVSWLQAASLLLVMVLSSPGTHAAVSQEKRHLCGNELVEALRLTCGDRGLKRGLESLQAFLSPNEAAGSAENQVQVAEYTFNDMVEAMMKRSADRKIVDQCCHNTCEYYVLHQYCGSLL